MAHQDHYNKWFGEHLGWSWFERHQSSLNQTSVPGYVGDYTFDSSANWNCWAKFERWFKRPKKSRQLYWRLHPKPERVKVDLQGTKEL